MNLKSSLKFTLLFSLLGGCLLTTPSQATLFEQREVNQEDFIAIARPYGNGKYDLLILQQIPGKTPMLGGKWHRTDHCSASAARFRFYRQL